MVDVAGVEVHPSVVPGRTQDYQDFVTTWAPHCGAPSSVFIGHLNVVINAELALAGQDIIEYARGMVRNGEKLHTALDRLLVDLINHLQAHDCYREGCLATMTPTAAICPGRAALVARITRARTVLGLDPPGQS